MRGAGRGGGRTTYIGQMSKSQRVIICQFILYKIEIVNDHPTSSSVSFDGKFNAFAFVVR